MNSCKEETSFRGKEEDLHEEEDKEYGVLKLISKEESISNHD